MDSKVKETISTSVNQNLKKAKWVLFLQVRPRIGVKKEYTGKSDEWSDVAAYRLRGGEGKEITSSTANQDLWKILCATFLQFLYL